MLYYNYSKYIIGVNNMITGIYVRKSKFTGKGESIQNQIQLCKEYAISKGYTVDDSLIYHDEGFSGGNINRPAFQKMIKDVKANRFDVLICYRLDRISRSVADFSDTLEMLNKYDVSFVSIKEQFDTTTPMGRAMIYISSVFAQLERETAAERIKDNMLSLAETGRWLGGITPTGFYSEAIEYIDRDMKERTMYKLSPIKEELNLVKLLYDKYLEFKSLARVETYCLQNHIKSKKNKDFNKNTIRAILINPVYAIGDEDTYNYLYSIGCQIFSDKEKFNGKHGVMVYNKTIEKKNRSNKLRDPSEWIAALGKHKGIIEGEKWVLTQNMLLKNRDKAPRQGTSSVGLLSGLIRCSKCGQPMRVKHGHMRKDGTKNYYYVCTLKDTSRSNRCDNNNLNGPYGDRFVVERIKEFFNAPDGLLSDVEDNRNNINSLKKELEKEREKVKIQINNNQKSINHLVKQLADNENSTASKYIIKEIEELDKKNIKLQNELNTELSLAKLNNELINISMLNESATDFVKSIDSADTEEKKKLLHNVVSSIYWDGDKIEVNFFGKKKLNNKGYPYNKLDASIGMDSIFYTPSSISSQPSTFIYIKGTNCFY
ncbi:recombinase family protein [Vallitalea sediminicola]